MNKALTITFIMFLTLSSCEKSKELSYLKFEQQVFYELFPKLIDKVYRDKRLTPQPPPSPEMLKKKGFGLEKGYNNAYKNWKASDDYIDTQVLWEKYKDSINKDTTLIYVAIPDSISQFEEGDLIILKNHFKNERLLINSSIVDSKSGFKIDLNKLKTNQKTLKFKYISEFPKGNAFWDTDYDFYLSGSLGFSRILFDQTKSFGVLNVGFMHGNLNGSGCRIFIKKDETGKWIIDKIIGTWVS